MPTEQTPARPYLYTARFETVASVITPAESQRELAMASLQPLRALVPADCSPEIQDDVLYIAAAGACAGLINANGDGISAETAIAIHRSAVHKYVNVEHDRDRICGCVINAGLTRKDTNEPLTDEEAATLREPFNLSIAGALWKTILPQMSRYLVRVGDEQTPDSLSLSWEIGFNGYHLAVGSKNLWEAKAVMPDDPQWDTLQKCLRKNGGTGKGPDGRDVYRVISGDAVILGYSVVASPAADVKGILPITESVPAPQAVDAAPVNNASMDTQRLATEIAPIKIEYELVPADVSKDGANIKTYIESLARTAVAELARDGGALSEKIITLSETRVTPNHAPMKIENAAQLASLWPELRKEESAASVEAFVAAIQKANDSHLADINTQKDLAKSLEQAKAAAEQKAQELTTSLAQVQKQVDDLKQAALAAEQNSKFQERMASFDEDYDLDDEDRQIIASDIKGLSDESFAAYQKKCAKLMCGKKKGAKASTAVASTTAPVITAATVTAAVASITPVAGQTVVPAGQVTVDVSINDEVESAFGSTMRVGKKSVAEIKAEHAARAPKE